MISGNRGAIPTSRSDVSLATTMAGTVGHTGTEREPSLETLLDMWAATF